MKRASLFRLPRAIAALVGFVALPQLAGAIGSYFTLPAIDAWYAGLAKAPLNPPSWVFGPVWTTLYVLMGVAAFLAWRTRTRGPVAGMYAIFAAQLTLNALWSVIFFGMRLPGAALGIIVMLALAIILNIIAFSARSRAAGYLLWPYLAWVLFATYLNLEIVLRN